MEYSIKTRFSGPVAFVDASLQFSIKTFNLMFEELAEVSSFRLKGWS